MTKGTAIRTIVLVIALLNQVLAIFDVSPLMIADAEVELLVSTLFTVVTAIIAWWKNNSFSKEAIHADAVMKANKSIK